MPAVPKVKDFFLLFLSRMKKDPLKYLTQLHNQYGDVFQKHYKGVNHYFTCQPQHAEHILTINQDNYKKHPSLIKSLKPFVGENNLFTTNNIPQWQRDHDLAKTAFESAIYFEDYAKVIAEKCQVTFDGWERKMRHEPITLAIRTEMEKLLSNILKDTIFNNIDVDAESFVKRAPEMFQSVLDKSTAWTPLSWIFPTKAKSQYNAGISFVHEAVKKIISSRLASKKDYDDLLGTYLHAYQIFDIDSPGYNEVANQILLFNIVGFITTEAALCWTLVKLAQHPEVEGRIAKEVNDICGGNIPTYQDYAKLKYTQAVICEVLRLYPSVDFFLRQSIQEDDVKGYKIDANSSVLLNTYLLHRHPEYWSDPEKFDPERFLNKPWGQDYQFAYLPFGAGRRGCMGRNFAFMEMCLIVAMLSQRFRLTLPNKAEVKLNYLMIISTYPDVEEMILTVK